MNPLSEGKTIVSPRRNRATRSGEVKKRTVESGKQTAFNASVAVGYDRVLSRLMRHKKISGSRETGTGPVVLNQK